jgi:hypothetical protein
MKMIDLGEKPGKDYPAIPSKPKDEKYYPSLYLSDEQIKTLGVKSANVGDETLLQLKVRVSSLSENKSGRRSVTLEMIEAMVEEKDPTAAQAKALYTK